EIDEDMDLFEYIDSCYARVVEKDENDTATTTGPIDNNSEWSNIHGESSSFVTVWGRWALRLIGFAYLGLVAALLIRCSIGYYGLWRFWRQRRPAPAHVHAAL